MKGRTGRERPSGSDLILRTPAVLVTLNQRSVKRRKNELADGHVGTKFNRYLPRIDNFQHNAATEAGRDMRGGGDEEACSSELRLALDDSREVSRHSYELGRCAEDEISRVHDQVVTRRHKDALLTQGELMFQRRPISSEAQAV